MKKNNEEKGMILKVFDIDYSFIIKNYLDPKMWEKDWTVFIYKGFVFKLKLTKIYTTSSKIIFELRLEDTLDHHSYKSSWGSSYNEHYVVDSVEYSLKIEDTLFLKNKITSSMFALIKRLEEKKVRGTQEYLDIDNSRNTEKNVLRGFAENFLDENRVYNSDIREVYIESYIDNNSRIEPQLNNYIESKKYMELTDLYLIYARIINSKVLGKSIEKEIEEACNGEDSNKYKEISNEVNEYICKLESEDKELEEKLKDNLENI